MAYHGGSERRAREILDTMLLTLDRMAPLLGADREEPIRVTVYNSWNEMRRAIPPSSAVYGRHLITEGAGLQQGRDAARARQSERGGDGVA